VMAQAVQELFPGTKLTIGPPIEDGFYYDFDSPHRFAPEDLEKSRSLGLKGMRERVSYHGGSIDIARAPRGGTRVRLRVPLRFATAGEASS